MSEPSKVLKATQKVEAYQYQELKENKEIIKIQVQGKTFLSDDDICIYLKGKDGHKTLLPFRLKDYELMAIGPKDEMIKQISEDTK